MEQFTLSGGHLHLGAVAVPLTPKERAVFAALAEARGEPVASEALIQQVWGNSPIGSESLHRCVSTLRSKLARHGAATTIQTIYGYGYRLSGPSGQMAAAEAFRQVMEIMGRRSKPEMELGRRRLAQIRATHPDFLPAYVFGAHAEISTALLNYAEADGAGHSAVALADDLLARDPRSADALAVRGFAKAVIWAEDRGFDDLDASVARDRANWLARYYRAWALAGKGAFSSAIADFEVAWRDHRESVGILGAFAHILCCAGEPERALCLLRDAFEMVEISPPANAAHAIAASMTGHHEEAIAAGRRVAAVPRMSGTLVSSLPFALARAGRAAEAAQWLARIEAAEDVPPAPAMIAPVFLTIGRTAAARAALAISAASRCPYRHIQRFDPRLSLLHA